MTQTSPPVSPSSNSPSDRSEAKVIQLLEERLRIKISKEKVGEVIVRKAVETEMIKVPIRREKLIVEQVSPDHRRLAEVDLGQGEIVGLELPAPGTIASAATVSGEFQSLNAVRSLLDAIAMDPHHRCGKVRLEIEVHDPAKREQYRQWMARIGGRR